MVLCSAASAHAQVSAALSLDSEYRLRGLTLSNRQAALSLSGAAELPNGVYAGGALIAADTPGDQVRLLGHLEQLGYAFRDGRGVSWDIGLSNTNVEIQAARPVRLKYSEIHLGVSRDNLSARIFVSPNYQGNVTTAYLDLDATRKLADDWRASAHLGVLKRLSAATARVSLQERYDLRLGLIREFSNAELRLDWFATHSSPRPRSTVRRRGLVAGASLFF